MNYIDKIALAIYENTNPNEAISDKYLPLYRIYAVLALIKGTDTTQEDVHHAWSAWCCADNYNHRSLIPFDELTPEVQYLDQIYVDAIHEVVKRWDPLEY